MYPAAEVVSNLAVWGLILDHLVEPDAVYRSVSEKILESTDRVLAKRYDVDKFLYPIFGQAVPAFRKLQRDTGALVCGSWAVAFFKGRPLTGMGPPDIVVPVREYLALSYFLEMNGFIPVGDVSQRCIQNETVVAIRTFALELNSSHAVRVISTPESPIATVLRSYISITVNFIASDQAMSVFPRATFCNNQGLVLDCVDGDRPAIARYAARGFGILEKSLAVAPWNAGELSAGKRVLGDARCWVLRLSGAPSIPSPACPYSGNSFELRPASITSPKGVLQLCAYKLKFETVEHALLSSAYTSFDACARFIDICVCCIARRFPNGPMPSWTCYFVLSYDEIEVYTCDDLVPLLTEAWMHDRTLAVVTDGLVYRFDPRRV